MLISVIIPVYNTIEYLEKCLDSVLSQTHTELEIICVDDGSTDGSAEWLDECAGKDSRVKVIHKENGGSVTARKAGVMAAAGDYIGYVDSDDYVEPDMYESLSAIADEYKTDIVTSGYFLEGNYTTRHIDTVPEGLYEKERMGELRDNLIYCKGKRETGVRGSLCCKLFKASVMKEVQLSIPDNITTAEDKSCLLKFFLECKSAYILKESYYHWVIRRTSKSHRDNNDYLLKIQNVQNFWVSLYNHPNFSDTMRTQAEIYIVELLFLGINKRMGFKNKNMIWIDPYWMDRLPRNARIVLYGGGELGEKYKKQLLHARPDVELTACVDPQYRTLSDQHLRVDASETLAQLLFDYIVITVKNKEKAENMKEELVHFGISDEKIIWCEQPEAYWRFIEAEGLI